MASYVAWHEQTAKEAGPYAGTDLPAYKLGQHCPVTLPSRGPEGGWKAATEAEWDETFCYDRETNKCRLNQKGWHALKRLHMQAYYASGDLMGDCTNVKDTIAMFVRNGLARTPWTEGRHFWGLKNSVKKAAARSANALQVAVRKQHDDAIERLLALLDKDPPAELSHQASYSLESAKTALREAAGRGGFAIPSTMNELRKLLGKMLGPSGECPDCLVNKLLLILEHAKGGTHAGRARSRDCKICNEGGRGATDVAIDTAHKLGKTLTPALHARLADLLIAHARPDHATRAAEARLAKALRMAEAATVEEDERALAYASTTRHGADDEEEEDRPTFGERRGAAIEAEQARLTAERQRRVAREARQAALPPVKVGTRVVVIDEDSRDSGRRGVVQGWRGPANIMVRLGRDTSDRRFFRRQLRIETPRKPAAKPAAKKPSARKPAKKKAKKASKK